MSGLLPPFLSAVGFSTPWLLWALLLLPLIWLLLRLLPPAPVVRRFPGVALLLGLTDEDAASARTPPWLLLLRMAALALAILGFAGPVRNPAGPSAAGQGPLLILADADWANADQWPRLRERLLSEAGAADAAGRPLALVSLSDASAAPAPAFGPAGPVLNRLGALEPAAWEPPAARMAALAAALPAGRFETLWLSDGLARDGRAGLLAALMAHGPVRVLEGPAGPLALTTPVMAADGVATTLLRPAGGPVQEATLVAYGPDPAGVEREFARQPATLAAGANSVPATLALPQELRNRLTRIEIAGHASAGAVVLADDALKRRKVGIAEAAAPREGLELLSPIHYLRQALRPGADLVEGTLADLLPAAPQVIVLADVAHLPEDQAQALAGWVEKGGLLVRFAGPRLAASVGPDAPADPLLPVALRPGDRATGGSMSWDHPHRLGPFADGSPFAGLPIPADVTVRTQVLAEPGPDLADHTIASLEDGTPLVTEASLGKGRIVLFHVTASADWSNLPLSGLFVRMLDRLAISSLPGRERAADLKGTVWTAERQLDGYGRLQPADGLAGVAGERLGQAPVGPDMPPGLYRAGERRASVNVLRAGATLAPMRWPASVILLSSEGGQEQSLKGPALGLALLLLAAEGLATLIAGGRIAPPRRRAALALAGLAAALALALTAPRPALAQDATATDDQRLIASAGGMILAHVLTGDAALDGEAQAGLAGLSMVLTQRTSVEPGAPVGVDPEKDDLSVYTFLYWPVSASEPLPSAAAYRRLNLFLHTGGLILFDTRDADGATPPGSSPEARRLQELAAALDIPPLAPIPHDHVLTRAFYLLDDFPGRYAGNPVWAEAPPPDAEQAAGMPFRNLNDGVTPVVIGGNDWAAAWAVDADGNPMVPVGRGVAGERQRELAYRFGVNLVMHVLTGNYKSDQVHVPALLERLGQ